MIKTNKKKEVEDQIELEESRNVQQRKGLSRQYPDLFSNEGKVLKMKV